MIFKIRFEVTSAVQILETLLVFMGNFKTVAYMSEVSQAAVFCAADLEPFYLHMHNFHFCTLTLSPLNRLFSAIFLVCTN